VGQEVRERRGSGGVTSSTDPIAPLDFMKLEKLPFLSACVREGIRLLMELSLACHGWHTNPYSTKIGLYLPGRQSQ
jgi:hypothetical protein